MITKICGIQNEDTLLCCERNKVNFFGMIFYPKSPRNISIKNANILQKKSKDLNINGVGVFVDKNINDLARIADMHYVIEKGKIVWQGNSTELLKQKDHLGNKLGV